MSLDFHSIGLPFPLILSLRTEHPLEFSVFDVERTFTIGIRTSGGIWIRAVTENLMKAFKVMKVIARHWGQHFEQDLQSF